MKTRRYKGAVIEQVGLSYYVWLDFVTADWIRPRFDTLAQAKAAITAARREAANPPLHVAAVRAYNDAIESDGVTESAWWAIAGDLHLAADELTGDRAVFVRDRAKDAEFRAQYAARMVQVARQACRVIDVQGLAMVVWS